MATITRTLKKGKDTGKLNRAEVRAVTAAIRDGRTADVLSGRVLQQFRASRDAGGPASGHASNGKPSRAVGTQGQATVRTAAVNRDGSAPQPRRKK